ncbi:MAG: hypothetical protein K2Y22_17610 [Candidatus Obscuribacterales bacterium]|nr:hypothetical protein [Candidatus Obscuribacterales bacterium]
MTDKRAEINNQAPDANVGQSSEKFSHEAQEKFSFKRALGAIAKVGLSAASNYIDGGHLNIPYAGGIYPPHGGYNHIPVDKIARSLSRATQQPHDTSQPTGTGQPIDTSRPTGTNSPFDAQQQQPQQPTDAQLRAAWDAQQAQIAADAAKQAAADAARLAALAAEQQRLAAAKQHMADVVQHQKDNVKNMNADINNDTNPFTNRNRHYELVGHQSPDGRTQYTVEERPGHIEYRPDGSAVVTDKAHGNRPLSTIAADGHHLIDYSYDNQGHLTSLKGADGHQNTFAYNNDGQICQFTSHTGDTWVSQNNDGIHWQCVGGPYTGETSTGPLAVRQDGTLAMINMGPPVEMMKSHVRGDGQWDDGNLDPWVGWKMVMDDYFKKNIPGGITPDQINDRLANPKSEYDRFVMSAIKAFQDDRARQAGFGLAVPVVLRNEVDAIVDYIVKQTT